MRMMNMVTMMLVEWTGAPEEQLMKQNVGIRIQDRAGFHRLRCVLRGDIEVTMRLNVIQ